MKRSLRTQLNRWMTELERMEMEAYFDGRKEDLEEIHMYISMIDRLLHNKRPLKEN